MRVTNFDQIGLKNIVNRYLKGKDIDVHDRLFNFNKSINNLADIKDRIKIIIDKCKLGKRD